MVRKKTTPVFLTEVNSYNALNKACNEKNGSIIREEISVWRRPSLQYDYVTAGPRR